MKLATKIFCSLLFAFLFSTADVWAQGPSNPSSPAPIPGIAIAAMAAAGYGLKKANDRRKN